MCTYSQFIEDRATEKGIQKGIELYKSLMETKSIEKTASHYHVPAETVREIALKYQVETTD